MTETKHSVLMRDIIIKFHPRFKTNDEIKKFALKYPDSFNVEHLVEECFPTIGKFKFVDGIGYDNSDYSEDKTASIRLRPLSKNTYAGEISGVSRANGNEKIGALRCIIYNPHTESLKFYFLPKKVWKNMITIHPTSKIGKIVFSYNLKKDTIRKFEGFECKSFRQLALAN
jgi:hypothetical protein